MLASQSMKWETLQLIQLQINRTLWLTVTRNACLSCVSSLPIHRVMLSQTSRTSRSVGLSVMQLQNLAIVLFEAYWPNHQAVFLSDYAAGRTALHIMHYEFQA